MQDTIDGTIDDEGIDALALIASRQGSENAEIPTIAGYQVETLVGRGTFGAVYRGRQLRTGQTVALKVLHYLGDRVAFSAELQRLLQVSEHPYIVKVIDADLSHAPPYLVTPFFERTLANVQRISPIQAKLWLRQLSEAVGFIHERGLYHLDLKPANVLLDAAGNARVVDFGQSRLAHEGVALGTFWYMSPQQALGGQSEPSWDIYSIAATIFQILVGVPPRFDAKLDAALNDHQSPLSRRLELYRDALPCCPLQTWPSGLPVRLRQCLEQSLELDSSKRLANTGALLEKLSLPEPLAPGQKALLAAIFASTLTTVVWLGSGEDPPRNTGLPNSSAVVTFPMPTADPPKTIPVEQPSHRGVKPGVTGGPKGRSTPTPMSHPSERSLTQPDLVGSSNSVPSPPRMDVSPSYPRAPLRHHTQSSTVSQPEVASVALPTADAKGSEVSGTGAIIEMSDVGLRLSLPQSYRLLDQGPDWAKACDQHLKNRIVAIEASLLSQPVQIQQVKEHWEGLGWNCQWDDSQSRSRPGSPRFLRLRRGNSQAARMVLLSKQGQQHLMYQLSLETSSSDPVDPLVSLREVLRGLRLMGQVVQ